MGPIMTTYLLRVAGAALGILFIGLVGCGGPNHPFLLLHEQQGVKPGSIVVISGSGQNQDTKLAELLTKELKERSGSGFRVVSQEEVAKAVTNYPQTINRRHVDEHEAKPIWFDPSEKSKLDAIQTRLKADYVFVVWGVNLNKTTYTGRGGSTTTYSIAIVGNMLQYPGSRVVSTTEFSDSISDSILALFRPKNYYIEKMLADCAERIAEEFVSVTNRGRS